MTSRMTSSYTQITESMFLQPEGGFKEDNLRDEMKICWLNFSSYRNTFGVVEARRLYARVSRCLASTKSNNSISIQKIA